MDETKTGGTSEYWKLQEDKASFYQLFVQGHWSGLN